MLLVGVTTVFLTSCVASIPKEFSFNITKEKLPDNWASTALQIDEIESQSILALVSDETVWRYVQEAMVLSPDLKDASLKLKEAQLVAGRDSAGLFPSLTLDTSAGRSKSSETSLGKSKPDNSISAGLSVSWEMDVWGKLDDQIEADEEEILATSDDLKAARALLSANILRAWVRHSSYAQIIAIEKARIDSLGLAETVIEDRFNNGLGDLGDLDAARSATASAKATLAVRINSLKKEERRLSVLAGRLPRDRFAYSTGLPEVSLPGVDAPANVIGRRPDLKAAFRRIKAADKNAMATYKDILPSFKLTSSVTKNGTNLPELLRFDPAWTLVSALSAPIFDAGLRKTRTEIAENKAHRQWLDYRIKLLNALEEIENALDLEESLHSQAENRLEAEKFADAAYQQQVEKYASGLTDVVTLLTAERTAFDAKIDSLNAHQQRLENRITLALALGYEE